MKLLTRQQTLDSFQRNSLSVMAHAKGAGLSLTDYLDRVTERNKDDELSTLDWMLWREGVNCYDAGYTPSSRLSDLGDWTSRDFDDTPVAKLFYEKMGDRFAKTMYRGLKDVSYRLPVSIDRAGASMLSKISAGTAMNLYNDTDFYRAEQFGPTIDYMDIIGAAETTTDDAIRKNKYNNTKTERTMQVTPEAVAPLRMELAYSSEIVEFTAYGIAIEATYDFLNASQTRTMAIMNALDEVALQYRTVIFEEVVKKIVGAIPTGHTVNKKSDGLTMKTWREFRMKYNHYGLDIVLGNAQSIAQFEELITGQSNTTLAHLAVFWSGQAPGASTPLLLNKQPMIPRYGWYDELTTQLPNDVLITFDKLRSSKVWFKRSLDQDETKRDPENRTVTRFLNTQVAIDVPDPNGIYKMEIG